ncbi:MAG TPA: alanine--glyoxylate aminotransferase family protein [Terriglobales bacterium]|nr:alanine--glyoxylate aminotransferase family protein [Terriglobales bacterium]
MTTLAPQADAPHKLAELNPPKRLLFGPGPTQVHPRIYEVMSKPIVGHLDPFFFQVTTEIRDLLQPVFGTQNPFTIAISGTGSAGMEAAVSNFVESGSKVAVFANGYFADRISEMARRQDGHVVRFEKPWGEVYSDSEAVEFIRRERPQVVAYVTAETSTGAFQKGKAICDAAHEIDAVVIADCVTSLGAMPVEVDKTGIDVAYSCSQKGLSCPPGLSPITVSPRALSHLKSRKTVNHSWYLDLTLLADYYEGAHRYHHTAPITLFYALREALNLVAEEGLDQRLQRHYRNHKRLVKGLEEMRLRMHVPEQHRIWNLNTPLVPEGVNDANVRARLLKDQGIEIAGGFGPLAGKVFRIGIMGPLATEEKVDFFLQEFRKALAAEGYKPH